jgi:Na+:H+ antiporter, NhaC family
MIATEPDTVSPPSFVHSALCFGGVIALLSLGLFVLRIELHSLMFLCLLWTAGNAWWLGYSYLHIRQMMSSALSQALPAIYIFFLIGMVIASFMQSGTIASLIYYGLQMLSPGLFLLAGLLLCSLMSLATGTSWGTAGTIGVVLMGIGAALGLPSPLVAGMIVAGATFGDKLSPVSDTTNLAAMSAGTALYRHIRSMLYTTLPSYGIMVLIMVYLGMSFTDNPDVGSDVGALQNALAANYQLNAAITFVPLLVMLVLSARRVAAEVSMSASIVAAILIAILYQQQPLATVLNSLWINTPGNTGLDSIDQLLGRGGMYSMAWTLLLALMALTLGGILHEAGFLRQLLIGVIRRVRRVSTLVVTTIASGLVGNMAMGEAYISIILSCQLFKEDYDERGVDRAVLSRSVEEGATMTTGLIPWTTAGAFYTATLGVSVIDYAPYAFFNYLNIFVSVSMAAMGVGLLRNAVQSKH